MFWKKKKDKNVDNMLKRIDKNIEDYNVLNSQIQEITIYMTELNEILAETNIHNFNEKIEAILNFSKKYKEIMEKYKTLN